MNVYIFTGPTISGVEARRELEAIYLPPAAEGDVYRVTLERPKVIGIIDGYFQSKPPVRHKEILWAMSRGVHVIGAGSMGALRAAELATFGMEGVGVIFQCYMDGRLEDDDEVAIAHGPADVGYLAASEAMVDIRETLRRANHAGIISTELQLELEKIGKQLFYPDRNYRTLLQSALERGSGESELAQLREWLPKGRVSQKREDALAMLRLIRRRIAGGVAPKTVNYSFEHTSMWEHASRQFGEVRSDNIESEFRFESLVDELRLEPDQYKQHRSLGLERFLSIREADRLGMTVTEECRKEAELEFRQERNLLDSGQITDWIDKNGSNQAHFDALMTDEARVRWVHKRNQFTLMRYLADQLRLSGAYPRLFARAEAKERLLESFGLKNPCLADANLTERELVRWYFKDILGRRPPADPTVHSRSLGFASYDSFRRTLLKEYLYRRLQHESAQILECAS